MTPWSALVDQGQDLGSRAENIIAAIVVQEFGSAADEDLDATVFELGGNSLHVTRIVNRLRAETGWTIPLSTVFAHSSPRAMAQWLAESGQLAAAPPGIAENGGCGTPEPGDEVQLSQAQLGIWLLQSADERRLDLNLPIRIDLDEKIDALALESALSRLADMHPALRTVFRETADGPRQSVIDELRVPLATLDLRAASDPEAAAERVLADDTRRLLDLASSPARATLLLLPPDRSVLQLVVHHLVADGVSAGVLLRDLSACYRYELDPTRPVPAVPRARYLDHVRAELSQLTGVRREQLEQHWCAVLADPLPPLPFGFQSHPASGSKLIESMPFRLSSDLVAALGERAHTYGVSRHVLLLGAFATVLTEFSGADEVVICVPWSGREQAKFADVVGMFVNNLPVRLGTRGADKFAEIVERTQKASLAAYEHSALPYTLLAQGRIGLAGQLRRPIFDTAFQLTDFLPPAGQISDLAMGLYGQPESGGLAFRLDHDTRRVSRSDAADVRSGFCAALALIAAGESTLVAVAAAARGEGELIEKPSQAPGVARLASLLGVAVSDEPRSPLA